MLFQWPDGTKKICEIGKRIHGLKYNGVRPPLVILTKEEIFESIEANVPWEWWRKDFLQRLPRQYEIRII